MGTSLINTKPQDTYPGLIKTTDNAAISATLKTLSDGNGNDFPMQISTTAVNFTGTLTQNGLPVTTPPSGVSGAIQFSNGSAFASDAANLFWDDTNNRLGVGTNAPSATAHFKGSGTTSGTTSLLVQNSAGADAIRVRDDGVITIGSDLKSGEQLNFYGQYGTRLKILTTATLDSINGSIINSGLDYSGSNNLILASKGINSTTNVYIIPSTFTSLSGSVLVNTTTDVASSVLTVESTTKGFLPPRMTTTQKNAISSPASGLMVYDSTTNKLCCYNGSTWNDLF